MSKLREVKEVLKSRDDLERFRLELRQKPLEEFELMDFLRICHSFESHVPLDDTRKCKVAFLNSFTLEPIRPVVKALGYLENIDVELTFGPYNQFEQILINLDDRDDFRDVDFLVLAMQIRDLFPEQLEESQAKERLTSIIQLALDQGSGTVLVTNFVVPTADEFGILSPALQLSERNVAANLNQFLASLAAKTSNLFVLDVDSLASHYGKRTWTNNRQWYGTRTPLTGRPLYLLAHLIVRFLKCKLGDVIKCIAVDCDNTLWGGIVGEDGSAEIQVGHSYPGNCYRDFQKYLLRFYERGILLTINSKNNSTDVFEVLEDHPEMVLRKRHFTIIKANWNNKVANLLEIAEELNIGLESIVFVDDSPHEIAAVNEMLPQIRTFLMPPDPSQILEDFRANIPFDTLTFSQEDKNRPQMYGAQMARKDLLKRLKTLDEFYAQLEMRAEIFGLDPMSLSRMAQLTQRTNQFNLTTRRYSERELSALDSSQYGSVFGVSLRDKLGDNGIVGVLACRHQGDDMIIDTLLMSCRVIGRTLEQSMVAFAGDWARQQGASRLIGEYLPNKKNMLVADFYSNAGFKSRDGTGEHRWYLNVEKELPYSQWIEIAVRKSR